MDGNTRGRREEELARYFKLEYGEAEVDRLFAQARAARHPSPGRFWARLRRRLTRQHENGGQGPRVLGRTAGAPRPKADTSASPSLGRATPGKDGLERKLPAECQHAALETLGSGGNATYLQCRACGVLVVSQRGRLWNFAPDRPQGI